MKKIRIVFISFISISLISCAISPLSRNILCLYKNPNDSIYDIKTLFQSISKKLPAVFSVDVPIEKYSYKIGIELDTCGFIRDVKFLDIDSMTKNDSLLRDCFLNLPFHLKEFVK